MATDEECDALYSPMMEAFDATMAIPAVTIQGLGIKARMYMVELYDCVGDSRDEDVKKLLADIERLAGEG